MTSLLVEASRTMPHPIRQGHTHTSRVQLSVDLDDDSVTGEDLVQAAESMLQQADAILESQTNVLTFNIKESEQCEYLVGEYVKFLKRIEETGSPGDQEDTAVFHNLQEQLIAKGFDPKHAMKVGGDWGVPRVIQGGRRDFDENVLKPDESTGRKKFWPDGIFDVEVKPAKPSEPAPAASSAEPSSQQSETVAEPAPAEPAATPSA